MRESPVKDVIVEKEPVFEEHATENRRFDKLRDLLAFESCIGAPIEVLGEVRHALFLFHRQPSAFARVRPQHVDLDMIWLGVLLEEQAIAARLRALNPLLLSGELAMALAHEVYNKVGALELELANLVAFKNPPADLSERLATLYNSARDLKTLAGSFQEMMRAKESSTAFNVNDVIRQAEALVRPLARKEGVKIDLRLADNLPRVTGNRIALQQVFFNLMLNAIQWMVNKPDKHRLLEI
ncbi:MAG: hypothetical protein N2559_18255, partial [Anaerolineae bacterium]|nr:hypothetical protein [Anaerolineae bacterium]